MRIFAIRDESLSPDTTLGYLIYYERPRAFYIELPENVFRQSYRADTRQGVSVEYLRDPATA